MVGRQWAGLRRVAGDKDYASTTAKVYLTINGSKASSGKRLLNDDEARFDRVRPLVCAVARLSQ